MRPETKDWLEMGEKDLTRSKNLLIFDDFRGSIFNLQQSIEKFLKAAIIETKLYLHKSHDLNELVSVAEIKINFHKELKDISQAYLESRYPDMKTKITFCRENCEKYIEIAEEILEKSKIRIVEGKKQDFVKEKTRTYKRPDFEVIATLKVLKIEVEKLVKLDKMFLFGSRARGDFKDDSDVDVILISKDFSTLKNISETCFLFHFKNGEDVICLTPDEFEEKKKRIGTISDAMEYAIEIE